MEQQARDYFVRRLNEIANEKLQAKAVELFGASGRPQQPTWGEGELTLKEGTENNTRAYLNPDDVVWPAMDAKKAELEAYRETIAKEKQSAMDAVYLDSDAQKALAKFQAI
jgi:hypothetical protein